MPDRDNKAVPISVDSWADHAVRAMLERVLRLIASEYLLRARELR